MRKTMIAAALISGIALQALEKPDLPTGLLLAPQEWADIKASSACKFDQVIYLNGSKHCGDLVSVPSLVYSFGTVPFKIKDLSLIIFSQATNQVQYVTHEGSSFVGRIDHSQGEFTFTIDDLGIVSPEPVDLKKVRAIVLKEREPRLNPISKHYTIELNNGESFSVQLDSIPIALRRGKTDFLVHPEEIVDICFNGGLYGETTKGHLDFSLLKDHYLEFHIGWANQTLRLPWESISRIRRQENISLLETHDEKKHGHVQIVLFKEPEQLLSDHGTLGMLEEIAFESNPLFELEEAFSSYASIAFEAAQEFGEEIEHQDYSQIAFDALQEFSSEFLEQDYTQVAFEDSLYHLDNVALTQIADQLLQEVETGEAPSVGHDLDQTAFAGAYEDSTNQGIDNEEEIVAISAVPIEKKDENLSQESEEEVIIVQEDGDEEVSISDEEPDSLDALNVTEEDPMVYVANEIHTLGEYTTKNRTLVREHVLNATLIPTDSVPVMVVRIPGFFIDKHLVTNREYQVFVRETGHREPSHWNGGTILPGHENDPVVNVTFSDAKAYAAWIGKRLPNEQEWIRAANQGVFSTDDSNHYKEWTASPAYPSEGDEHDLVVIAPWMFKEKRISQIPQSAPREIITILNQNICNETTGFRCVTDATE